MFQTELRNRTKLSQVTRSSKLFKASEAKELDKMTQVNTEFSLIYSTRPPDAKAKQKTGHVSMMRQES